MTLRGGCLCGRVRYVLTGTPLMLENCHCSMCRKAHGGAYTTYLKINRDDFAITDGADLVETFRSSPAVKRSFCRHCGGKFTCDRSEAPDYLWLAAGGLDDDPGMTPSRHIFTASKADWFDIEDDLPRYDAYPTPDHPS